jgi:CTP synthase (UTP-ammonia lyase)
MPPSIALVGDYDPAVTAHQAIPVALARAASRANQPLDWEWVGTSTIGDDAASALARFGGVWCVPASPYANTDGALSAIRFARETGRPFLGTCGGFQHALIEYARANWGVPQAAHAELEPSAVDPVIVPLACALVESRGEIHLREGTRLSQIYGTSSVVEGYHCRYGLSATYTQRLDSGPLRVAALDADGDVRAVELDGHPFYFATLFQPERAALTGQAHPLVAAFVAAVIA